MAGSPRLFGAVELGGTKIVCAIGTGPDDVREIVRLSTRDPAASLADVTSWLVAGAQRHGPLDAVGVAAFGPVETRRDRPAFGRLLATPKEGWAGTDVVTPVRHALNLPTGLQTDVVGAALAEERWGAGRGVDSIVYVTVGTGIGAGAIVRGRPLTGVPHAEMGHQSVARQPDDTLPGVCPFHGDCLEGLAAGPALRARWGAPAEGLTGVHLAAAVDLEARYLADGLRTIAYTLAPHRIVVGGGVSGMPGLLAHLRTRLRASLAGYPGVPEHDDDSFLVAAVLGDRAGALGGFVIAEDALESAGRVSPARRSR